MDGASVPSGHFSRWSWGRLGVPAWSWVDGSLQYARGRVEVRQVGGELIIAHLFASEDGDLLDGITRLEEIDGRVARIQSYPFSPETLAEAARQLSIAPRPATYHQPADTLERMIATTCLPWIGAID